ncbi:YwqG family protein [Thermomonospora echinospora]|nr:YwqG family protein [Thermomonospora echinospora]
MAEIERHCVEVLGEHGGAEMAALVRRGHALVPVGDGEAPAGRSRLGGAALLESGTPWPEVEGIPLSLLAVLDTDALARWLGAELPVRPGLLNFFFLEPDLPYEEYRHLDFLGDERCRRVIAADPAFAVETSVPAPATVFDERPVTARPLLTLPGNEESVVASLDLGPGNEDKWPVMEAYNIRTTWPSDAQQEGHRAFGWPWPFQSPVMEEDEVHLLQLDSDDHFQWGDMGVLYFTIPADALRKGDFGQVRIDMHCS